MVTVTREITKEEYEQAQKDGADDLIPLAIHMGYGVYGAKVYEEEGKFFLTYEEGSGCD